jgi:two-component system, cell cycle sensor histidine kinase and response regulator CckA
MRPRHLDLNEVVSNMANMLSRMLGEDVALELGYWPNPAVVRADTGMLEQVLLNLAVNARDAMPRGGQFHVRTSIADLEKPCTLQHADAHQGRFVCLTATDTGCGIPPEILDRIFEPFFTTKEAGKGTGLGLATVYGIVKQHEGWIEVESKLGHGTTFRIYFPSVSDADQQGKEQPAEVAVRGGSETILVVEDEQLVRELVGNLLHGYGYRILEAASGAQALEVWREHKDSIALVVTDVVMPGTFNGRELAEMLWAERPGLKVVLTSGYSADVAGREWVVGHGLNYLQKPYHPRSLALAVRDCLDAGKVA